MDTLFSGAGILELTNFAADRLIGGIDTVLTHGADHTIRGSGNIGSNFIGLENAGQIEAAGAAGLTLRLRPTIGLTRRNTGILRAANGSSLTLSQSGTILNFVR